MSKTSPTRIAFIHRYFWPDTSPYGILLRCIAEHFASQGNHVSVFTGEPTYAAEAQSVPRVQELADGLTVRRAGLFSEKRLRFLFKAINDVLFCFRIAFFVLRARPDVVMCSTQPPVIGAAAAGWAARRVDARFVYHMQDIHPEVVCETGHVRPSLVMRLLKWIDKRTVAKADRVVLLSQDMLEFMQGRVPEANDRLSIIPNFNLPRFDELQSPPADWVKKPGTFRLMFAGNVGRFQNLEAIVDACLKVDRDRVFEFVLMGDGKAKADLRRRASEAGDERIRFLDRQPLSIAEPLMADADICVVSLEPEVYRYAFPSKLASHLSLGTPVLVVCEQNSQLSRLPIEHGFGLASPQSPEQAILEQINFAIDHPEAIAKMRERASQFFVDEYSLERVLPLWTQLFGCVLSDESA